MKKEHVIISAFLTIGFLTAGHVIAQQAGKENYNVAVFLYDGVELLDFAGPGEVFSAAGFKVYTMSVDGNDLLSQGFVRIKPEYSLDTAPDPDIVIFPGGGSGPTSRNQKVLDWINARVKAGALGMSVCTGASILANAGLLKGLNVTTWYGFIPQLQKDHPDMKVLPDTRFVDNRNVITTAGVSAGIDGALHAVARIKGLDVAKKAARYMEYDKWKPEEGRVDIRNAYIEQLTAQINGPADGKQVAVIDNNATPYLGELKNLAIDLKEQGKFREEARVLEIAVKIYPNSSFCYNELALAYKKIGKPAPTDLDSYVNLLKDGKLKDAVATYQKDQKNFAGWNLFDEPAVNALGYKYLAQGEHLLAINIFEFNTKLYPESANAFDSLGEGYFTAGKKNESLLNYKKSLELNPANKNAKDVIAKIERGE